MPNCLPKPEAPAQPSESDDVRTVYRVTGPIVQSLRESLSNAHPSSYPQGAFLPDNPVQFDAAYLERLLRDGQIVAYRITRKDI